MDTMIQWVTSFSYSFFAFILILLPLVVFHELGHFLFAKMFGVKAEVFSIGFGPSLWKRHWGETEFRIAAIPLGGFVKLLGEERGETLEPQDLKRALHSQVPWKRFLIFFGGPLFNFILAMFIFMLILLIGEFHLSNVVSRVAHHSLAAQAGFRSGDQILSINDQPVKKFEDILALIHDHPQTWMTFQVLHSGATEPVLLKIKTKSQKGWSMYGEAAQVGEVNGLLPYPRSTRVGISDPQSQMGQFGVQTGDQVIAFNQKQISNWEDLENEYDLCTPGASFILKIQDFKSKKIKTIDLKKPLMSEDQEVLDMGSAFGLYSSELFVDRTMKDSPAEKAGLLPGDRLVRVDDQKIESFFELKEAIQQGAQKNSQVVLVWERQGRLIEKTLQPVAHAERDPLLNRVIQYTVGVIPQLSLGEPVWQVERIFNPIRLIMTASERMLSLSLKNFIALKKIVTGDVSVGTLGGPLMIGKIAGESIARGWIAFLTNMAIFSIGLGVLNILPIPVLDGGHLLLLGVEMVRRRPLTVRQMEILQGVGLVLILALTVIAFHNDLSRIFH